jgi:hypothetical protein
VSGAIQQRNGSPSGSDCVDSESTDRFQSSRAQRRSHRRPEFAYPVAPGAHQQGDAGHRTLACRKLDDRRAGPALTP